MTYFHHRQQTEARFFRKGLFAKVWLLRLAALMVALLLAGCGETAVPTPLPPPAPTSTPPPTALPLTHTPPPTLTPQPTAVPPSATPPPTIAPTLTPAGQSCVEPPPRPVYRHLAPAADPWPTPNPAVPERPRLGPPLLTDGPAVRNDNYPYGYDGFGRYLLHNGLDLIEPLGTAVLAAADGVVVVAQADDAEQFGWRCGWYGLLIIIEMDERWQDQPVYLLYGHLDAMQVAPGERATAGQTIGALGVSGATIGAHLHFEVRVGENSFAATRNPSLWLAPSPGHGLIAGQLLDETGRPWQGVLVTAVSQPDGAIWRNTWSYLVDPAPLANPDERLAENFVLPELPAGEYQLVLSIGGVEQRQTITVAAGEIAISRIVVSR